MLHETLDEALITFIAIGFATAVIWLTSIVLVVWLYGLFAGRRRRANAAGKSAGEFLADLPQPIPQALARLIESWAIKNEAEAQNPKSLSLFRFIIKASIVATIASILTGDIGIMAMTGSVAILLITGTWMIESNEKRVKEAESSAEQRTVDAVEIALLKYRLEQHEPAEPPTVEDESPVDGTSENQRT